MGACLATTTLQEAWLEACHTGSSAQGHTPFSSSLLISARYFSRAFQTWFLVYLAIKIISWYPSFRPSSTWQLSATEVTGGSRPTSLPLWPPCSVLLPQQPTHTANIHPHLAAPHLPGQPHLYTYTAPTALGSTGHGGPPGRFAGCGPSRSPARELPARHRPPGAC